MGLKGIPTPPLEGLIDVNVTNLTNGQVLEYNSSTGQWVNATPSSGAVTSVNGETGAITLTSTSNTVSITPSGSNIDLEVESINGLLAQGTNVTITGSGTAASPYNISASGGGGGSPGGSDTNIQVNKSGAFYGDNGLNYDYSSGFFGVNQTALNAWMHVKGDSSSPAMIIEQPNNASPEFIKFQYNNSGGTYGSIRQKPDTLLIQGGNFGGNIQIAPYAATYSSTAGLTVGSSGNVYIGQILGAAPLNIIQPINQILYLSDTSTTGATRLLINTEGINVGFELAVQGIRRWSNACYPYVNTSIDYTFFNDQIGAAAFFVSGTSNRMQVGFTGDPSANPAGQFVVTPTVSTTVGLIVEGFASQTADLTQWQNGSAAVLSGVNAAGSIYSGHSTTGSRPTVTAVGSQWFDTSLGIPIWWNGSNWVNALGTPV